MKLRRAAKAVLFVAAVLLISAIGLQYWIIYFAPVLPEIEIIDNAEDRFKWELGRVKISRHIFSPPFICGQGSFSIYVCWCLRINPTIATSAKVAVTKVEGSTSYYPYFDFNGHDRYLSRLSTDAQSRPYLIDDLAAWAAASGDGQFACATNADQDGP